MNIPTADDMAPRAFFTIGMTILKKIVNSDAPSIFAASKIELGIAPIAALMIVVVNGKWMAV